MSDAYIVRRGKIIQGGGGFDPNGAVLKVVTSTGCTVTVTGTGYSQTHQDSDGFPRSDDANVTEHFFSIPPSAFGTINVRAHNSYGDNTNTVSVNTAGRAYEVLCGGVNIILDGTFGLQSGYTLTEDWAYSDRYKQIEKRYTASGSAPVFEGIGGEPPIPVSAYRTLTIKQYNSRAYLLDKDNVELCGITFSGTQERTGNITNKVYPTAWLYSSGTDITEIILK
jgi:hypothetical protein